MRDSTAIARAFADLGSDLVTAVDWETGSLTIDLLSDDLDRGLGLLLDVGTNPSFDAPVVESSRRTRIRQLGQRLFEPAVLATDWFARALYGYSPYGSSLLGTERGLTCLTRDDLLRLPPYPFCVMVRVSPGCRACRHGRFIGPPACIEPEWLRR